MNERLETIWAVVLKLFAGSAFAILRRMILKTCSAPSYDNEEGDKSLSKYCDPGETVFAKGIFLMTVGWLAMAAALIYFCLCRRQKADPSSFGRRAMVRAIIPSGLDMVATVLSVFGIQWIALSLAFVFKGASVVFSAVLTVFCLKRRLYLHHWISVVICVAGLAIAASSQLLKEPSSFKGVVMVLGSELFKSLRVVYEEKLMKNHNFDPTFLVGLEGLYCSVVCSVVLFLAWLAIPGNDDGSLESLPDTLYRISHSSTLIGLLCVFPIITCVISITGAIVTKNLSAVHNGFISVTRVGLIWAIELALFYSFQSSFGKQVGEPWTDFSFLKMGGFIVVVFSTLLFDEDIKIRCLFNYDHLLAVEDPQSKAADI